MTSKPASRPARGSAPGPDSDPADLIAADCLAVRIRLLNRTISGLYDEAFRPLGLTAGQVNLLVLIAQRGPVAPGEIARRLNMEKSTVSRNVERMREHGWIGVRTGETDRDRLIEIRAKGRRLLEKALPRWREAQESARALLGDRGADSLLRVGNAVWKRLLRE